MHGAGNSTRFVKSPYGGTLFADLASGNLVLSLGAPASAATVADVQANNPQVASNTTATFPTNKQNEPTIAVDPASSHMIAGSNDEQQQPACRAAVPGGKTTDCSFFPGVGTDGVYISDDAGKTWAHQGLLDHYQGWKDSPYVSDGDPVIVYGPRYDPATRTFSTTAPTPTTRAWRHTSRAGSQATRRRSSSSSRAAPMMVRPGSARRSSQTPTASLSTTRTRSGRTRNPNSGYFGRLYASWTQFRGGPGLAEPIRVSYSADGGRTWSVPRQLSGASNNSVTGGRQGSAVRTDGNGNVYVVWEDGANQVYAVSTNDGFSYSRPRVIGPVADLIDPIPGSNFRNDSFLSLASDPRAASTTLYAAWVNRTVAKGSAAELVVYKTTGAGWSKVATPYAGSVTGSGVPFFQGLDVSILAGSTSAGRR